MPVLTPTTLVPTSHLELEEGTEPGTLVDLRGRKWQHDPALLGPAGVARLWEGVPLANGRPGETHADAACRANHALRWLEVSNATPTTHGGGGSGLGEAATAALAAGLAESRWRLDAFDPALPGQDDAQGQPNAIRAVCGCGKDLRGAWAAPPDSAEEVALDFGSLGGVGIAAVLDRATGAPLWTCGFGRAWFSDIPVPPPQAPGLRYHYSRTAVFPHRPGQVYAVLAPPGSTVGTHFLLHRRA